MKNKNKNKNNSSNKSIIVAICCLMLAAICCVVILVLIKNDKTPSESSETEESVISEPVSVPEISEISEPEALDKPEDIDEYTLSVKALKENIKNLKTSFALGFDDESIVKFKELFGEETVMKLSSALAEGVVDSDNIYSKIGYTENALELLLEGENARVKILENSDDGNVTLVFVGDISFADHQSVIIAYNNRNKGVDGIVDKKVLEIMRDADITMGNNEFTLSRRGAPVPNKKFTFRGDPDHVTIYGEMGMDIVGLANNHASDYGEDSLLDTIDTLDAYGMPHVGAGRNLKEAMDPFYFVINGQVYGYVAGSVIDMYSTRTATETESGVYKMYDTDKMCDLIKTTSEKADHVLVFAHWGVESTTDLTPGQKSMGKAFIDAGADVVVGMHSHCMQGIEYYKDKLIVYSLGNFTFSSKNLTCAMLKAVFKPDGSIENTFYPMMQEGNFTYINDGEKGKSQLELLKSISINVNIADDFVVTPKK